MLKDGRGSAKPALRHVRTENSAQIHDLRRPVIKNGRFASRLLGREDGKYRGPTRA